MTFYKRLYDTDFHSLSVNPRVYKYSSHQPTDPHRVIGKLLMENLYSNKTNAAVLDPRGMFVIHAESSLWIWVGAEVPKGNHAPYMEAI